MTGMKPVLIDSSSAILIFKVDLFDILVASYRLIVAEAVYREISLPGYPGADTFTHHCRRNHMTVIPSAPIAEMALISPSALKSLDAGERDTILAYALINALFVIIDDGPGNAYCMAKGIPHVNALLIIRILYFAEKISESSYHHKLAAVLKLGRYSQDVIKYGFGCSRQSLVHFMP